MALSADEVIRLLGMKPHPEGGHFAETFRDEEGQDGRAQSTAIYFLLRRGEHSHWHRVDATEVWHFYAGDALRLRISDRSAPTQTLTLGPDLAHGERPQAIVPAKMWQSAETIGEWTLLGCTVAPGFRFEGFELAPNGWEPFTAPIGRLPKAPLELPLTAKTTAGKARLSELLADAQLRDTSLIFSVDPQSGCYLVAGVDERLLDAAIASLKNELGSDMEVGAPQIAYREAITRIIDVDYIHKKPTGGSVEFARIRMHFEPDEAGGGFTFVSKITRQSIPEEFVPAVRRGIESGMRQGILAEMPVVNIRAVLLDGAYHEADSSALAFEIAGRAALREALKRAGPVILEPIVRIDITMTDGPVSRVIDDLRGRRGHLHKTEEAAGTTLIAALVPLANMFGYGTSLRSMGAGQANYSIQFSSYAVVPGPDDDTFPPAVGMRV